MRKLVLSFGLLALSNVVFGQIKKVEATPDEINVVGRVKYGSALSNHFTNQEIEKYNIRNTIAYLVEYVYENKVIHRDILGIRNYVLSKELIITLDMNSLPCFEVSSISSETTMQLIKDNRWEFRTSPKGESICHNPGFLSTNGIELLTSKDYTNYKLIDLAGGKIKLKLYRLEE